MARTDLRSSWPPAAILLLASLLPPHPATATEIVGAVGAANASPTGRAPDAPQRVLKPGDDVFFKDRIATKSGGSAQVTFLDRSTLNIGENSDVTIDEFVYRPGQAGSMRAKLKKGFLRYVGGDISHGGGATVATPTVTIGIRGGIGLIATVTDGARLAGVPGVPRDFAGGTIVVNGFGTLTVHNSVSETVISRPGFAAFVSSSGAPISAPVRFDMAAAQALTKALGSHKGQTGGASARTHAAAAQAVAARLPSMDLPVAHPVAVPLNGLDYTAVFSAANAVARVRSQAGQSAQLLQQLSAMPLARNAASPPSAQSPAPVGAPAASSPATPPVATVPVATAPVATTPETTPTTTPAASPPATTPVTTPVADPPAATPPASTPTATPPASTPAATPPASTPAAAAPATGAGQTGGLSIPIPGGTITIGNQGATFTPSPGKTTPTSPAPTPVAMAPVPTPTPVTTPVVTTGSGHDNGKGNGFANNGRGNGR